VVDAKRPFAGAQAVLAYLSRDTHGVAISNSRLIAMDEHGVTFKWKDYPVEHGSEGRKRHKRHKTMTRQAAEFMRRFLLPVLPGGLHRIRHDALLANGSRQASLALARQLLCQPAAAVGQNDGGDLGVKPPGFVCWHCGQAMAILQTFTRDHPIRDPRPVH
jgi:hypothetical protein